jgi:hypothetical protein
MILNHDLRLGSHVGGDGVEVGTKVCNVALEICLFRDGPIAVGTGLARSCRCRRSKSIRVRLDAHRLFWAGSHVDRERLLMVDHHSLSFRMHHASVTGMQTRQ